MNRAIGTLAISFVACSGGTPAPSDPATESVAPPDAMSAPDAAPVTDAAPAVTQLACPAASSPATKPDPPDRMYTGCETPKGLRHGPFVRWERSTERVVERGQYLVDKRVGTWVSFDSNGHKSTESVFRDDKLHGVQRIWWDEGKLRAEITWRDGVRDGPEKAWYQNGQPEMSGHWSQNKRVQRWESWSTSGELTVVSYDDGLRSGAEITWSADKKVKLVEGTWENNHHVGVWVFRYPNGQKKEQGKFGGSGEEEGRWIGWHPNGAKRYEGNYVVVREISGHLGRIVGRRHGRWRTYHDTGKLDEQGRYDKGSRMGRWVGRYPNGRKRYVGTYNHDGPIGGWRAWHANGKRSMAGSYGKSGRVGRWEYWHPNGKRWATGRYEDDDRVGQWKAWDEAGKPIADPDSVDLPDIETGY